MSDTRWQYTTFVIPHNQREIMQAAGLIGERKWSERFTEEIDEEINRIAHDGKIEFELVCMTVANPLMIYATFRYKEDVIPSPVSTDDILP